MCSQPVQCPVCKPLTKSADPFSRVIRSRAFRHQLHVLKQRPQQPAGRWALDAGRLGPHMEQIRWPTQLPAPAAPMRPDPAPPTRLVGWPVAEPHSQGPEEATGVRRSTIKHWGGR